MILRRIASVVLALLLTGAGYVALWSGGVANARAAQQFRQDGPDVWAILLVLLGLVLLAAAMLTVVLSGLGAVVVGALHLVLGILVTVGVQPALTLIAQSFRVNQVVGAGISSFLPGGFALLTGAAFLACGIVAGRRVTASGIGMRVLSLAITLVAAPAGTLLAIAGGGVIFRQYFQFADFTPAPGAVLLALAGTLLFFLAVTTVRWSSLGAIVVGAIGTVVGLVCLVAVVPLANAVLGMSRDLSAAIITAGSIGHLALLGMLLLAAGVGARLRRVRVGRGAASV